MNQGNGSGNFQFNALNFDSCISFGGSGGASGGGGAAGTGGAIFILGGNVTISNVTFFNNAAMGGNGGLGNSTASGGGGGGPYLGDGGNGGALSGGGGGGFGGQGGSVNSGGGGGGGGGGISVNSSIATAAGGAGSSSGTVGQSGGGFQTFLFLYSGGAAGNSGPAGGAASGGGGGGGVDNVYPHSGGGGGGGSGISAQPGSSTGDGGVAGFGGGGGGGDIHGAATSGNGGEGVGGGGGGAATGFTGGYGGLLGGGGGGTIPGASELGGGGGALIGSSNPGGTSVYGGTGGNATGSSGGGGGGGGALGGGIFITSSSTLTIEGGVQITSSFLQGGSGGAGQAAANNGGNGLKSGWDLFSFASTPLTLNATGSNPNISFSSGFVLNNNLVVNGPGVVTIGQTNGTFPSTVQDQNAYFVGGNLSINSGTLYIDGIVALGTSGIKLTPAFNVTSGVTVGTGAKLRGNNGFFTSLNNVITVASGGTIAVDPAIFQTGPVVFLTGGSGNSIVTNHIANGSGSVLWINSNQSFSAATDLSNATLQATIDSNAVSPAVYVLLFTGIDPILAPFNQVLINGSPGTVYYSPPAIPNSVLYPLNVPFGVTQQTVFLGPVTFTSVVLFDPCAGLVVLDLVPAIEVTSVLSAFLSNQCGLTAQAIASISVFLNNQIGNKAQSTAAKAAGGPVAAWTRAKEYIAQASTPPQPPSQNSRSDVRMEEEYQPLFTLQPNLREQPYYSISLNTFGLFQNQDSVTTKDAFFSAYDTSSGGAIFSFDYLGFDNILVGGAATYVFSKLKQEENLGNQRIQSAYGTVYAGLIFDHLTIDFLVSGSYNHNHSTRNFPATPGKTVSVPPFGTFQSTGIPGGTARAKYNTFQLSPHFDLNYEIGFRWFSLLPFWTSDCVITFERPFTENGAGNFTFSSCGKNASLNTTTDSFVNYMLQNEVGINFFEQLDLKEKGMFIFRQKTSYVNRYTLPYILRNKFVGADIFNATPIRLPMQHFFGSAVEMIYRIKNSYIILTYEGMVGSGYLSNGAYFHFGRDF